MAISKGMFISQADMGRQAVNVLEKYKKHLAEEGASEEKQVAVIKAIKYCQDCADASHIIMAALEWQAAQNGEPAEEKAEDMPVETPKCKRAPRKKAEPKTEEKPKEEPAPTLFDEPLEKPAETPKAEEVKEPPKEELKPQETKAEEPANDNSLDDLF
jgi:outer membrane biosynthesis protein TonB